MKKSLVLETKTVKHFFVVQIHLSIIGIPTRFIYDNDSNGSRLNIALETTKYYDIFETVNVFQSVINGKPFSGERYTRHETHSSNN